MEKSFLTFASNNPNWKAGKHGSRLLQSLYNAAATGGDGGGGDPAALAAAAAAAGGSIVSHGMGAFAPSGGPNLSSSAYNHSPMLRHSMEGDVIHEDFDDYDVKQLHQSS